MAFVQAGRRGSRLKELTDIRAKPAVYLGGKTRIIDFAPANAVNANIRCIGCHAKQDAQRDPPLVVRLELSSGGTQRVARYPAGITARE